MYSTTNSLAVARRLSAPEAPLIRTAAGGDPEPATRRTSVYYVMRRKRKPQASAVSSEGGGDGEEPQRTEVAQSPDAGEVVVDVAEADQRSEPMASETAASMVLSREGHINNDSRLKTLMKKGLLSKEKAGTVDVDRLEEQDEDFTAADWNRLAIHPRKLQPLNLGRRGVVLRTIVGERSTFTQGKGLVEKKAHDVRISTSSTGQPLQRRRTRLSGVSPDKVLQVYQQKMSALGQYERTQTLGSQGLGSPTRIRDGGLRAVTFGHGE